MTLRIRTTVTTEIELSIDKAAEWFCGLDDDQMARFLVAVAERAEQFECSPDNQWYYLGGHLRNCGCSTEGARDMVRRWAHWIDHSNHGVEHKANVTTSVTNHIVENS